MNFIDRFYEYTKNAESPRSYFKWAACSAIAAVMRDNIYQIWEYGRLYPNLYILLVGPPAVGKALPLVLTGKLIKTVNNTKVIEGSASIQAVVKTLGTYETGGQKGASCIIYSEELSSFYVKDQNTNVLLTDLYDFHEKWERNLISWNATLTNVCTNLLAASNEVLLKEVLDSSAIQGGFLSRTILVIERKKHRKDGLLGKGNGVVSEHGVKLGEHLKKLSKVKGEIVFSEDAIREFGGWYDLWEENNPRSKTGIEGRMKTHIKKVAMVRAMGEEDLDLIVLKEHMEWAIEMCLGIYRNYAAFTQGTTGPKNVRPEAVLLKLISDSPEHCLNRKSILRNNLGDFNVEILGECQITLEDAELIHVINQDNEIYFKFTSKAEEIYGQAEREGK